MIKVFPILAPSYYPSGPISLAEDLEALACIIGPALIDSLHYGFVLTGLPPQDLMTLITSAHLSVRVHPDFVLIQGSVYQWCKVIETFCTKDSDLRIPICQVFFVLENTAAKIILKKYKKRPLSDGSFTVD